MVRRISKVLGKAGVTVWLDEERLAPGTNFVVAISEALANSSHILVFLSPRFLLSEWVTREWSTLFVKEVSERSTRIIPVLLEDIPDGLPAHLALLGAKQYVDVRGIAYSTGIETLCRFFQTDTQSDTRRDTQARVVVRRRETPRSLISEYEFGTHQRLAVALEYLSHPTHPSSVLITGLPGSGKTHTAFSVAHSLQHDFPDGCAYVSFDRGHSGSTRLSSALAAALAQLTSGREMKAVGTDLHFMFQQAVASRRLLIVADDVRTVDELAALLPEPPAALIGTSHVPLSVAGVNVLPLTRARASDAVEFLLRLAPQCAPVDAELICRLVGHLPLAIRNAAHLIDAGSGLTSTKLSQTLQPLAGRLAVLSPSDLPSLVERYELFWQGLSDTLRASLVAFQSFCEDFTAEAAASISDDPNRAALHALMRIGAVQPQGETERLSIHPMVHSWLIQLGAEPPQAVEERHAVFFGRYLKECEAEFLMGDQAEASSRCAAEWPNIEKAFGWAQRHCSQYPTALTICATLPDEGRYLLRTHLSAETQMTWLTSAIAAAEALGRGSLVVAHLAQFASLCRTLGRDDEALAHYEEAFLDNSPDRIALARLHANFGNLLLDQRFVRPARQHIDLALTLSEKVADEALNDIERTSALRTKAVALLALSRVLRADGNFEAAREAATTCMTTAGSVGDLQIQLEAERVLKSMK